MNYGGKEYTVVNGNGSVAIKTLLPVNSTTTLVGGNGYEYWVDGLNYPPLTLPDTVFYSPGRWRIEVQPSNPEDSIVFLHTIDIGDTIHVALAGGLALQSNFSVGADWEDTLYFFSSKGDTNVDYHVFQGINGARNIGIFAADLLPGFYSLKVDGFIAVTVCTDTNGILKSALELSSGNHTVEIAYSITTSITGQVTYNNNNSTPLQGVSVFLQDTTGVTLDTATTSAEGIYHFNFVAPGKYILTAASSATPGGYNTTDAMLVMKHFVNLSPLSGLYLKAASVRVNYIANSLDALYIQKRFSQVIGNFPKGDWIFEEQAIHAVANQSYVVNLKGLCYGDVNGSF
jgi:hypothetical protein